LGPIVFLDSSNFKNSPAHLLIPSATEGYRAGKEKSSERNGLGRELGHVRTWAGASREGGGKD
jgi:hypothetical protein